MSAATKFSLAPEIALKFDSPSTQTLCLEIKNEKIELVEALPSIGSVAGDFNALRTKAKAPDDAARYFLFKVPQQAKKFWCISWIPDGVSPTIKLQYAATKSTLKNSLGADRFVDDVNFTTREDFDYDTFTASRNSSNALSEREKAIKQLDDAEEEARREFGGGIGGSSASSTGASVASRAEKFGGAATPSNSSSSSYASRSNSTATTSASSPSTSKQSKIGGFHSVTLPLNSAAANAVASIQSKSAALVVLKIDDSNENVELDGDIHTTATANEFASTINKNEPRFYVYVHNNGLKTLFVYVCPDNAPQKSRMVYATAKAALIESLRTKHRIAIDKALEWGSIEIAELDEKGSAFLTSEMAAPRGAATTGARVMSRSGGANGGEPRRASSASSSTVTSQHPIYGLMTDNNDKTHVGTRKKIVIPPKGAW